MLRTVLLLSAVGLVVAVGAAEGVLTGRWQPRPDRSLVPARVAALPATIGEWSGVGAELPDAARQMKAAGLDGYLLREYTHAKTAEAVRVLIVWGDAGPVAGHPPTLCYQGLGYEVAGLPDRRAVPGLPAEFWAANFEKPADRPLHIWWAWTETGPWEAPDRPWARFARADALYKAYFIRTANKADGQAAEDPFLAAFAETFLPALESTFFTAAR